MRRAVRFYLGGGDSEVAVDFEQYFAPIAGEAEALDLADMAIAREEEDSQIQLEDTSRGRARVIPL